MEGRERNDTRGLASQSSRAGKREEGHRRKKGRKDHRSDQTNLLS